MPETDTPLSQARRRRRMTRHGLARAAQVPARTVRRAETGGDIPAGDLRAIRAALDIPPPKPGDGVDHVRYPAPTPKVTRDRIEAVLAPLRPFLRLGVLRTDSLAAAYAFLPHRVAGRCHLHAVVLPEGEGPFLVSTTCTFPSGNPLGTLDDRALERLLRAELDVLTDVRLTPAATFGLFGYLPGKGKTVAERVAALALERLRLERPATVLSEVMAVVGPEVAALEAEAGFAALAGLMDHQALEAGAHLPMPSLRQAWKGPETDAGPPLPPMG